MGRSARMRTLRTRGSPVSNEELMAFAVSSMSAARQGTQKASTEREMPTLRVQRRCGGITQDGMLDSVTELPLSPQSVYFFLPWSCGTITVVVAVALLPAASLAS